MIGNEFDVIGEGGIGEFLGFLVLVSKELIYY